MAKEYSPSVNIIRDREREFDYIPTPNGRRVVAQMSEDFQKGIRAFNIIGSYGTGKSSFLLALEQSLSGKKVFYEPKFLLRPKFDAIKIVGSFSSIIDAFATELSVTAETDLEAYILAELHARYRELRGKSALLFVVVDEFGKFLEYAAKHGAERELYFVQQLAEFVNTTERNIVFITTVHQGFESYAPELKPQQRNEWTKVKGRFREILFNEPVEQLLYLASEHLKETARHKPNKSKEVSEACKLFIAAKGFETGDAFAEELSEALFPLDLFAAHVLTLALQRYGQNERSLFSFLESTDYTSLEKFRPSHAPFYSLAHVFDYLNFNLYSFLWGNKTNPDGAQWSAIKDALERMEREAAKDADQYAKLIKTIGLLNIFAAEGSVLDEKFLVNYARVCLNLKNAKELISWLAEKNIILYQNYKRRYIPFGGTTVDIQRAILEAEGRVDRTVDLSALIQKHYSLPPMLAKTHAFRSGTSRYFEFSISKEPESPVPVGEVDGYINLVFNTEMNAERVRAASAAQEEAIVYGVYSNTATIAALLFDIEKTEKALDTHRDDDYARREFQNILVHYKSLLNHYILDGLYDGRVQWYWNGIVQDVRNKRTLNSLLSQVCDAVYHQSPVFKNELVNKHKISASVGTAKRNYFKALANNWQHLSLGFDAKRFPPEKMIFVTLLQENGLQTADEVDVTIRPDSSFSALWDFCNGFLRAAERERLSVDTLITDLGRRPFKLKGGFIDVWVPTFLFLRRSDFALYYKGAFVPEFSFEQMELMMKRPEEFAVKSFDLEGVRLDVFNSYRALLNQQTTAHPSKRAFVETIRPFLKLYRDFSEYTKQTKRLSPKAAAIREAILTAKDPEQTFFETFPAALGTSMSQLHAAEDDLKAYTKDLQDALRELRQCNDGLVARFEDFIRCEYGYGNRPFAVYKAGLQKRYAKLKRHLLTASQKVFVQGLDSALDDRGMWLTLLAQALVGRKLETFRDEDEPYSLRQIQDGHSRTRWHYRAFKSRC